MMVLSIMFHTITPEDLARVIVSSRTNNKDNLLRYVLRKNTHKNIKDNIRASISVQSHKN